MSFSDWLEEGWTVERNTPTKVNGVWQNSWSTHLSGLEAIYYSASVRELERFAKSEIVIDGFVEMDALDENGALYDVTEKDRFVSPRGEIFDIKSKENPHNLDEFLKFAVRRTDVERQDE